MRKITMVCDQVEYLTIKVNANKIKLEKYIIILGGYYEKK